MPVSGRRWTLTLRLNHRGSFLFVKLSVQGLTFIFGKMFFKHFFFIFLFVSQVWSCVHGSVTYKGGIIFVQQSDIPVTVNPQLINFHRRFDLEMVAICMEALDKFALAYRDFCEEAMKEQKDMQTHVLPPAYYREASFKCLEFSAQMPEIRSDYEADQLLAEMKKNKVTKTFAGLSFSHGRVIYISNGLPVKWFKLRMCDSCATTNTFTHEEHDAIKSSQGKEVHFLYEDAGSHLIVTAVGHIPNASCVYLPVVCVVNTQYEDTMLKTLAKHSCMRDRDEVERTNDQLRLEIEQFKSPSKRIKRSVALAIGAGFLGMESIKSMVTGSAPLSFLGKSIASIFGFATADDMKLTKEQLERHSQALTNLSINQLMLIEAHTKLAAEVVKLELYNQKQEHDTAVLFANLDNKVAIYNLQTLLQVTLLKMSNAVLAATQHDTSPYAFGQADLNNVTSIFRNKNIPLTSNIHDVITSLALVDNIYTFIFSVPIINLKNNFHFYELRDLPIHNMGKHYKIDIQNRYFAINSASNEYILVTETEYRLCTTLHVCNVAAPFMKINAHSPCEILTLKYSAQNCKMVEDDAPASSFLTFENLTFYSIANPMEIHIVCTDSQVSFNEHKTIMGTGQIQIVPGCQIQATNDISMRPGFVASRHNLESNTLFKILQVPGMDMQYPTEQTPIVVSQAPISFRDVSTIPEAFQMIFNQDTAFAEGIRILVYILIILTILGSIYCFSPKFRLWLNGCCFFQKPTVYWRDVRGYKVPEFLSRARQTQLSDYTPIKVDDLIVEQPLASTMSATNHDDANINTTPAQAKHENDPDMRVIENAPYPFNILHRGLYNPLLVRTFK